MPNGRSAHFWIKKLDLAKLVDGMPPSAVIGDRHSEPVTVAGLLEILADELLPDPTGSLGANEIYVSEQDHSWYVIAFGAVETWMTLEKKSALGEQLDQYSRVVWTRVLIDRLGVFTRKDGGPLYDLEAVRPAHPDEAGRLTCPHCGIGFSIGDLKHWSGEKHTYCRGRVRLV